MNTATYETCSEAIQLFLGRTAVTDEKQRKAIVTLIEASPRPKALAKRYLARFGEKNNTVSWSHFASDMRKLLADVGPFDPVFGPRIAEAKRLCREGGWTAEQHDELVKLLRDSWCPWSAEDQRECREDWSDAV